MGGSGLRADLFASRMRPMKGNPLVAPAVAALLYSNPGQGKSLDTDFRSIERYECLWGADKAAV